MKNKTFIAFLLGIIATALAVLIVIFSVKTLWKDDAPSEGTISTSSESEVIKDGVLSLGSVTASAGDEITVPVTFTQNPGVWGIELHLEYDYEFLTYVNYLEGDIFKDYDANDDGNGTFTGLFSASGLNNINASGKVIDLKFKIKDNAPAGNYNINITSGTLVITVDEQTVEPKENNAVITVK